MRVVFLTGLFLAACGTHPIVPPSNEPALGPNTTGAPKIVLRSVSGSPAEVAMTTRGVELANRVMASPCFAHDVRTASFTEARDMSDDAIWSQLSTTMVSLRVVFYQGSLCANYWSKTIGYENDAQPDVSFMNRHFVTSAYLAADNMVHEAEGHTQGFRHDGEHSSSVPYQLNHFFEACAPTVGVSPAD
jgi:hypothetical protein